MTAIADLSATELAAAIRAKTISPVEAVEAALARIEETAELNAFMAVCADRARAEAKAAEGSLVRGEPLARSTACPSRSRT